MLGASRQTPVANQTIMLAIHSPPLSIYPHSAINLACNESPPCSVLLQHVRCECLDHCGLLGFGGEAVSSTLYNNEFVASNQLGKIMGIRHWDSLVFCAMDGENLGMPA